jgi:hypothetical protein
MRTCWAVHPVIDDISNATKWGEIKYINQRYIFPSDLKNGIVPSEFVEAMEKAAEAFEPDDRLIIVGDHLQLLHMASLLALKLDSYHVLRYSQRDAAYVDIEIKTTV